MAQLEALDSDVEVNGQTVQAFVDGVPDAFERKTLDILASNGIESPTSDDWYPQQAWLDAFAEIAETVGENTLSKIGEAIPRNAEWPPGVEGIVSGLESIDDAYHRNHRGGVVGTYESERVDDGMVHVRCDNPYPCAFDQGIIAEVTREFTDSGVPRVIEIGDECRDEDGDECVYEVTW